MELSTGQQRLLFVVVVLTNLYLYAVNRRARETA